MSVAAPAVVEPAYLWVPPGAVSSAAVEAIEFGESIGIVLDAEQRIALNAILAEDASGKWAALEAALIAARQNLKTFVLELVVLADLYVFELMLDVWTAHQFPVTMEAFRDIKLLIENHDHLRRRVKRISEANGEEGFELFGGHRLLFKARTKSGGRGLTSDRLILDEAFELTPSMMGSVFPTMAARPNPQIVYASSAGRQTSNILRAVRDRGRAGGDPSLVYVEWCAPVKACGAERCDHRPLSAGCALDDQELWQRANPAMGRRITAGYIEGERRSLPPEEFARERLGWWDEPESAVGGISGDLWESRRVAPVDDGVAAAYAVDVTPNSGYASIVSAWPTGDGFAVVVVDHRRGTDWVADRVVELVAGVGVPVVVDKTGPASVVISDIERLGVAVSSPKGTELSASCAAFVDGLMRGSVTHVGQPDLDAAVRGAVRAPSGDAWKWSRKSSAIDISPLVAATLAVWGAQLPPEDDDFEPFVLVT